MDLNANQIVAFAREMAMQIKPIDKILEAYGYSEDQFKREIEPLPFYQQAFKSFVTEWESATSTNKRLAIKAAAALEEFLPDVARRMADDKEALSGVVATAQWLTKLAGAGEEKASPGQGEKFKIIINLGNEKLEIHETKQVAASAVETEEGPSSLPTLSPPQEPTKPDLSGFPQGESLAASIRNIGEGKS